MSESKIEWTERTWNPIVGCSILTPGCTNCYAMKMAARLEVMGNTKHYAGTTKKVKGNAVWTGKLAMAPDHIILEPLHRKKPTTYFVNSMGDLFHERVPDKWITLAFAVMACSPQHTFQILTKRADRMRQFCAQMPVGLSTGVLELCRHDKNGYPIATPAKWPLPNVWLGVSAERQQEADERIPHLLQTPAAVRFISAEPLLGPVSLVCNGSSWPNPLMTDPGIDWVIVGGESGPNARPMHPNWARLLRDQCAAPGVAFFFKQWGNWKPLDQVQGNVIEGSRAHAVIRRDGKFVIDTDVADPPNAVFTFNFGKKSAGRLLDGTEHNAMPSLPSALAGTQNQITPVAESPADCETQLKKMI